MVISILTLDIFRSIRFAHSHVFSRLSDTSFDAFYYALKTEAYDHLVWNNVTVSKAVWAISAPLEDQPIFLSIDDTMIKNLVNILNFVLNCMIMLPTMVPITSMDTTWSVSCSPSLYTGMRRREFFPPGTPGR